MQLSSEVDHHLEIPGVAQHGAGLYSFKFRSNLCQQSVSHDAESTIGFSVSYTKLPASPSPSPSPFLVSRICIVAEKLSKFHGTGTTHRTDRKFPCAVVLLKNLFDRCSCSTNVMLSAAFAGEPTKSMRLREHRSVHFLGRLRVTSALLNNWMFDLYFRAATRSVPVLVSIVINYSCVKPIYYYLYYSPLFFLGFTTFFSHYLNFFLWKLK